jgi:SRSO17 transposase
MLPEPTVPACLLELLGVFRGCFTAPTFQTFTMMVVGLVAQTGRRTVCGMLVGAGLQRLWAHHRAHRFFSHARWSLDEVGVRLAGLIVARLVGEDEPVRVVVDDTLFRRVGYLWPCDGCPACPAGACEAV